MWTCKYYLTPNFAWLAPSHFGLWLILIFKSGNLFIDAFWPFWLSRIVTHPSSCPASSNLQTPIKIVNQKNHIFHKLFPHKTKQNNHVFPKLYPHLKNIPLCDCRDRLLDIFYKLWLINPHNRAVHHTHFSSASGQKVLPLSVHLPKR